MPQPLVHDGSPLMQELAAFEIAHRAAPHDIGIITNALNTLLAAERFHFAETWIRRGEAATRHAPASQILRARALMHELNANFRAANTLWAAAMSRDPAIGGADFPLIRTHMRSGEFAQAEQLIADELARTAEPWSFRGALLQRYLGEIRLMRGDARGFGEYIGRLYSEGRYFAFPDIPWWAAQPLAQRRLLISHHDGFGDQILWQSALGHLIQAGCEIMLIADHALAELFAHSLPDCTVIAADRPFSAEQVPSQALLDTVRAFQPDYQATLMHVPIAALQCGAPADGLFTANLTIPPRAEAAVAGAVRAIRAEAAGRRVIGLAWDSRQRHAAADVSDALWALAERRSIPPAEVRRFCDDPALRASTHFVALHTHDHLAEYPFPLPQNMSVSRHVAANFADTAALMAACDGVLTIDTSIANLAAACAFPTIVALGIAADWRYGTTGNHAPWLRSIRLARMAPGGNWDAVFADLRAHLNEL